jgi:hypothetical protein
MRKLLVVICCGLGAVLLTPIAAQATTSQTIHLTGFPIDVGPSGCFAADLVILGNGVLHTTTNNAGDFWLTGTVEGAGTIAGTTFSGHATAWFGVEANARNFVSPFTADAIGTLADGTPVKIHQQGQFTVNAQGVITVNHVTVTCT